MTTPAELIATHVMGLKSDGCNAYYKRSPAVVEYFIYEGDIYGQGLDVWDPANNIAQAMEALETYCGKGRLWSLYQEQRESGEVYYECYISHVNNAFGHGPTPQAAICACLVKAIEAGKGVGCE